MNEETLKEHLTNIVIHGATPSTELSHAIAIEYKRIFPNSHINLSCGACRKDMCQTLYNFYYANTPS